jgi:hypothetical protein
MAAGNVSHGETFVRVTKTTRIDEHAHYSNLLAGYDNGIDAAIKCYLLLNVARF